MIYKDYEIKIGYEVIGSRGRYYATICRGGELVTKTTHFATSRQARSEARRVIHRLLGV